MTYLEIEAKLSALFRHGEILEREVRLTDEEAAYVRKRAAAVTELGDHWYKIQFKRGLSA